MEFKITVTNKLITPHCHYGENIMCGRFVQNIPSETLQQNFNLRTTAASESIREIHHRMPVILDPEFYEKWLNVAKQDPKELEIILKDGVIHDMKYYPVSTFVNSVKNNDPNCIKPIDEKL